MAGDVLAQYEVSADFTLMDEWIFRLFVVILGSYALVFLWGPPYLQLVREIYKTVNNPNLGSMASLEAIKKQWSAMWAFMGLFLSAWITGLCFLLGFLLKDRPVLWYMTMSMNHAIWETMALWTSWIWLPLSLYSKKQTRILWILIYASLSLNITRVCFGIWVAALEDKTAPVFMFYRIYSMFSAFVSWIAQGYIARLVSKCVLILQNTSLTMVQNIHDVLQSDASPVIDFMSNRSNGTAILVLREILIANSLLATACCADIFQQYLMTFSLESIVVTFGILSLMSQSRVLNYSLEQQRDKAMARRQNVISFGNLAFNQSKRLNQSTPAIRSTSGL